MVIRGCKSSVVISQSEVTLGSSRNKPIEFGHPEFGHIEFGLTGMDNPSGST
jgi:hypothetical protein